MSCESTQHQGFLTSYRAVASPESALQSVKDLSNDEGTLYRPDLAKNASKTSIHYFAIKDIEVSRAQINTEASTM